MADVAEKAAGIAEARLGVRQAGYCVVCDRVVERTAQGGCVTGHPAEAVTGRLILDDDEPLPELERFNLAAFMLAPIWGPAHGQWAGAFFLPIWLFADSLVISALRGGVAPRIMAGAVLAVTLASQTFFARRANGLAFRRVIGRIEAAEFARRERLWAFVAVPLGLAFISWAIYFDLVLRAR